MAIKLNEKYLRQITDVVNSASVARWWDVLEQPQFDNLVLSVAKLHHPRLSERDAHMALIRGLLDCMDGFNLPSLKSPVPEELERRVRNAIFEKLRTLIESFPWDFEVKFPLPRFENFGPFEFDLSESVVLRNALDEPQPHGLQALRVSTGRRLIQICVKANGYADSDPGGNAVSQAISRAKQVLYFLDTFSLSTWFHGDVRSEETYAMVSQERVAIRLPDSLTNYLCGLTPKSDLMTIYGNESGTLLGGALRAADTPEERVEALSLKLDAAKTFFSREAHADFEAIGAAMEWYIDSVTADNQTFAYIAACIGLEALLGYGTDDPSDKMEAMSVRLSDRYGFLLGVGRADREKLSNEFREMLKLRGKLVHARNKRLNADQRAKLYGVQNMLSSVIRQEVKTMTSTNTKRA